LALVEALLLASLELLLLWLLLLLLLLLIGKEVPKAKTIEKLQSESAMNSCKKKFNGLTFSKFVSAFLAKNMKFERTLFSLHDGFEQRFNVICSFESLAICIHITKNSPALCNSRVVTKL
jgi:hypothetical protein